MCVKRVLVALAVLISSGTSFAAHPLITDDTGTQGKGKYQLEVNSEFTVEKERQYNTDEDKWETKKETGGELATVLSYGITDNVDVVLGFPYQWKKTRIDGVVGLIYSISENVAVDIGIKGGLNKPETDLTFLAGIAWRF